MKKITCSKILGLFLACLVTGVTFGALSSDNAYAAKFDIGDTVEVYNTGSVGLYVRDASCGNVIGGKFDGERGTILEGPVFCGGYNRWRIHWDDGLEGWSAEDWLREPPDLTVTTVSASTSAELGSYIEVSWTVKNQGEASSGAFNNRISLATTPYGTDISLGNFSMGSIDPGLSSSDAQEPKIPESLSPGYYYVTVYTDCFQVISESNENNNINKAPSLIHITAPIEIVITPNVPSGPTIGNVGTSYTYSSGGSSSNLGHGLQYRFDWDDGTYSSWLTSTSTSYLWSNPGTYIIRAQARCVTHTNVVSNWSSGLTVNITPLEPETVSTPDTPSGPTTGTTGTPYSYTSGGAVSNLGHSVQYRFYWGDGFYSPWSFSASASHSWSAPGTHIIRSQARCATHTSVVSGWSTGLAVIVNPPSNGSISGRVYQSDGVTPIAGAMVGVFDYSSPRNYGWLPTSADGNYTFSDLATGTYAVRVEANGYAVEWYDGVLDKAEATPVSVVAPNNTPGINFTLEPGSSILGHVYESDGTTPIVGAQIDVFHYDSLSGKWVGYETTWTRPDGSYKTSGLPTGTYNVRVKTDDYGVEWYDNAYEALKATPVSVIIPNDTLGIDFILESANITQAWTSDSIRGPEITNFRARTSRVCVNYDYENPLGSVQKITCYDSEGNVLRTHTHVTQNPSGTGTWTLTYPGEKFWPSGSYRANVFINDLLLASVPWTVQPYFANAHSVHFESGHYIVELMVSDPESKIESVSVTGPRIDGSIFLVRGTHPLFPDTWWSRPHVNLGMSPPGSPLVYTFTITEKSGSTYIVEDSVLSYVESFATNLSPSNNEIVTGELVFSWTGIDLPEVRYKIELSDDQGNRIWDSSSNITNTYYIYDGPPLSPGGYQYYLVSWSKYGDSSLAYETFTISPNQPPVASFTYSPIIPKAGEEVSLNGSDSHDPDGEIQFYEWDLDGDGDFDGFTTSARILYYWRESGTYSVQLRVIDNRGAKNTFVSDIQVKEKSLWEKVKGLFSSSVKNLTEEEWKRFELIKSELGISNWPHSDEPWSDPDFYWIDDNKLLTVLKKKIEPNAGDLTYETYIIDTLHDLKLADSVANRSFPESPEVEKYFENMAEVNVWAEETDILLTKLLEGIIKATGGSGIGVGSILMLPDLCRVGIGLKLLDETLYRKALWCYFQLRDSYSSEQAFKLAIEASQAARYNNEDTQKYFESLWAEYGGSHISDKGGLKSDFKEQVIIQLRTLLMSALEEYKFEPYHIYRVKSPSELQVYDSNGQATGLVGGQATEEIPNSAYDQESGTVLIYPAINSYNCRIVGTNEGNYGLTVISIDDGIATNFDATDIPTSGSVVHEYTIDWDALSIGGEGVTLQIDSDGDGEFENTFTADNELSQDEFLHETIPQLLKQDAVSRLEVLETSEKIAQRLIDNSIRCINKSLSDKLWVDDTHLNSKHGKKVFGEEKRAVKELMHLLKEDGTPENVKEVCQATIDKLVKADKLLAQAVYDEAQAVAGNLNVNKEIKKCEKEFEKAKEELSKGHYDKAIDHYRKAWEHAQKALK